MKKKKENASEDEVDLELAPDPSSDEKGDAEVIESQVMEFIDDYANDEYEGKFETPPPNKRRGVILRTHKCGDFIETLELILRDINSKYRRTNKSLTWNVYDPYEEYGKETDLNCYFYTFCYAMKPDKMK